MPPFRIGCLLLRLGASFGDWVPPFRIGSLRLDLPICIVLFLCLAARLPFLNRSAGKTGANRILFGE